MGRKVIAFWLSLTMVISFIVVLDTIIDFTPSAEGGTIRYVNETGSGGAYTKIQDAINASSDGDTVFVYNGTYYENVVIDKSINLIGEDVDNPTINGSGTGDVIRTTADLVKITCFNITNSGANSGDAGLEITSNNNFIFGNNITQNNKNGILISSSTNNNITHNSIYLNSGSGVSSISSSINSITHNNIYLNSGSGISFSSSSNNSIEQNNINLNSGHGISFSSSSNDNIIMYNNISSNSENGVNFFTFSNNNVISNNNISNNLQGIYFASSSGNNIIINNNISNNNDGIFFWTSPGNSIINNNVYSNNNEGIYLRTSSNNNKIKNNNIKKNSHSIQLYDNSEKNIITNNNVSNNNYGIWIFRSQLNNVTNNDIHSNNNYGVYIYSDSDNNIITNNNVTNHDEGITVETNSNNNKIYHNNIISNIIQAYDDTSNGNQWDDGYPSGGNYWSNYGGLDNYKGPNQDIPGSDSKGDTPYVIDVDSQDYYPLMEPYTGKPLENYTLLKQGWNLISIPLIQEELNLTRVLGSIDGCYNAVQWYNANDLSDLWKHHKVGKPYGNDLSMINETMGFWVHITRLGDTIFLYNGTQPTLNQTIQLYKGWNLVGYPSLKSYDRTEGLNNLTFGTHVDAIWTYNAATQKWKELGPSDYFEIGRGYWVHAKTKCEWEVPL